MKSYGESELMKALSHRREKDTIEQIECHQIN